MSPVTHLLIGWECGHVFGSTARDRNLITWASVFPDVDGFGIIFDVAAKVLGLPPSHFYATLHHWLLHGLFGALLMTAIAFGAATKKLYTATICLFVVHLHFLCDLVGSRGPTSSDIWPIHYLGPFSEALTLSWQGQWPLNGWPNIAITLMLIMLVVRQAVRDGISPFLLVSHQANEAFINILRKLRT